MADQAQDEADSTEWQKEQKGMMFNFERAYHKAAVSLAISALRRISEDLSVGIESVCGLAQLGISEAVKWEDKAILEESRDMVDTSWISLSENSPTKDGLFAWITNGGGVIDIELWSEKYHAFTYHDYIIDGSVTHYIPIKMPPPLKGDE